MAKSFYGQEASTFIAEWLNARDMSPQGKRIVQFIEKVNALWDRGQQLPGTGRGLVEKGRIVSRLQRMFWRECLRFKSDPYFGRIVVDCGRKHETRILWRPGPPPDWRKAKPGTVLSAFVWLASQGLRERLTRCQHCSRWMFAKAWGRRRRHTFCSRACRQAHYAQNEEVKQRWAEYMRERRRRLKLQG